MVKVSKKGGIFSTWRTLTSHTEGANPLSIAMEIIIEIKQFNAGRKASHPFIEGI